METRIKHRSKRSKVLSAMAQKLNEQAKELENIVHNLKHKKVA